MIALPIGIVLMLGTLFVIRQATGKKSLNRVYRFCFPVDVLFAGRALPFPLFPSLER